MVNGALIGVVTVTYNSAGVLPSFLRCMFTQSHENFILYAVDNASIDNSIEILKQSSDPRLRIIESPTNVGVAEGNNIGIRASLAAGCTSILLINNDTEFGPDLIALLLAGLETYQADMTCPKMMYFHDPGLIWSAGGLLQPWLGYRSKHYGANTQDEGRFDEVRQITYVPTCCTLMRKELIQKVGLMDPTYFVYVDDVDFMYRAYRAGAKLIYLPYVTLLHKVGGATGGVESTFTIRYCTRNRVFYLLKHFGLVKSLPSILLYQAYFWFRLMSGADKLSNFRLRQRSFAEGYRLYRETVQRNLREEMAARPNGV